MLRRNSRPVHTGFQYWSNIYHFMNSIKTQHSPQPYIAHYFNISIADMRTLSAFFHVKIFYGMHSVTFYDQCIPSSPK